MSAFSLKMLDSPPAKWRSSHVLLGYANSQQVGGAQAVLALGELGAVHRVVSVYHQPGAQGAVFWAVGVLPMTDKTESRPTGTTNYQSGTAVLSDLERSLARAGTTVLSKLQHLKAILSLSSILLRRRFQ